MFQVEGTKYVFEAKNIQRMELLVLATLQWKMQPVTPLSFIDHVIRRIRLKPHLHLEFLRRCERLLLSVVSGKHPRNFLWGKLNIFDKYEGQRKRFIYSWAVVHKFSNIVGSRFVGYLPSVLATATMMHVIYQVEPCNHIEYENQLLGVLEISKVCFWNLWLFSLQFLSVFKFEREAINTDYWHAW